MTDSTSSNSGSKFQGWNPRQCHITETERNVTFFALRKNNGYSSAYALACVVSFEKTACRVTNQAIEKLMECEE